MSDRPKIRLYVEDALAAGASLGLATAQAHYLRHVMRLKPGDTVALFNGRDGEWRGRIDGFGKGWCSVAVADQLAPQAGGPDLWLVFAPVKRARIDFIAQKATELGVTRLVPVLTEFTAIDRVNTDRLRANAIEAAEQSGRLTVPEVAPPARLDDLLGDWPADRRLMFCDERGGPPVAQALAAAAGAAAAARSGPMAGPWAVLTGPEGGFSETEADRIRRLPFVLPVGLGPRILRADTAALAALGVWQALLGDWTGDWRA